MRIETLLPGTEPNVPMPGAPTDRPAIPFFADAARRIEDWGLDGLTTPETGHDPFLPLVVAAEHTSRVTLGTNVAIAFPRSPMTVAQAAWDLQRWSGGRFRLGLGTQVKGHNERRYSAPWTGAPGPRMRDYVRCLRAIFDTFQRGIAPSFKSEQYEFSLISPFFNPGPIEAGGVPLYISALNPYMARLAGQVCHGIRLHPLSTPGYVRDVLLPALAEGAARGQRTLDDIDIVAMPFVVTGGTAADVDAARQATRMHIAFYASTRTYHAVLQHHGWSDIGMQLHSLSMQGRWPEMGLLINDEMLDSFAVSGTYPEVLPQLEKRWSGLCSTIFLPLPAAVWQEDQAGGRIARALLNR